MPVFTSTPPERDSGHGFRLIRTPGPGRLTAIATCKKLIGCPTHFYQRRTLPCERPDCPACEAGVPWRWHGYVSAVDQKTHEHFIFEMTAQAAEEFTAYYSRHETLVGCLFEATRLGQHHNGRVLIRCKPIDQASVHLPDPPNVMKLLCHIWNIPEPEVVIGRRGDKTDRIVVNRPPEGNNKPVKPLQPQT